MVLRLVLALDFPFDLANFISYSCVKLLFLSIQVGLILLYNDYIIFALNYKLLNKNISQTQKNANKKDQKI